MTKLVTLSLLLAAIQTPLFANADERFELACPTTEGQIFETMTGYLVVRDAQDNLGSLRIDRLYNGKVVQSRPMEMKRDDDYIEELSLEKLQSEEVHYHVIEGLGFTPEQAREIMTGKRVAVSKSKRPPQRMVNYFNKDGKLVAGAILVPFDGMMKCYRFAEPVVEEQK